MIDYENINEKIAPFSLLVYDEDHKMFKDRSFITLMENTDRKYLTLEKRRDLKEMATIGHPWLWYFWRKKCLN